MTLFDYLIFGIMIFFVLLGLVRGFIRELASLSNWVGSGLLTVLLRPIVNNAVSQSISNPILSNIISSIIVFIIAIIGLSILTNNIAHAITTKFPSSINITLGVAFGFLKGFIICSLIFSTILSIFGDSDNLSSKTGPKWLQDSQTYRPLSFGAYVILPFTDSMLGKIKEKYTIPDTDVEETESNEKIEENNTETFEQKLNNLRRYKESYDTMNELLNKTEKTKNNKENDDTKKDEGGYKKDQLDKLNHLIDIL